MGLFDFLKRHKGERKDSCGGVTFRSPGPISNEEYQAKRDAEVKWIETHYIKGIEKQGKGYDFETLRKIALFSSRMEEFQKFDSKNAEYIKSWQF